MELSSWPLLVLILLCPNPARALKCYFCYGNSEDCTLPEDENGHRLIESSATMRVISCLPADAYCYRMHYMFMEKPVSGRGCGNETFCANQRKPKSQPLEGHSINECDLCSGSLCNEGTRIIMRLSKLIYILLYIIFIYH